MYPEPKVCTQNPAATTPFLIHSASIFLTNTTFFPHSSLPPALKLPDLHLELPARLTLAGGLDNLHGGKKNCQPSTLGKPEVTLEQAPSPVQVRQHSGSGSSPYLDKIRASDASGGRVVEDDGEVANIAGRGRVNSRVRVVEARNHVSILPPLLFLGHTTHVFLAAGPSTLPNLPDRSPTSHRCGLAASHTGSWPRPYVSRWAPVSAQVPPTGRALAWTW